MSNLLTILKETYSSTITTLKVACPKIFAAMIVIVVGLLVARAIKAVVHMMLQTIRFERLAEGIGISNVLARADVRESASEIVGMLVYWTVLLFTGMVALSALGFADASTFAVVGSMIPSVVVAVAILIVGLNASAFIAKLIQTAAVNAEVRQARAVRNVAHFGMSILVAIVALKQLGVPSEILSMTYYMFFGASCIGLGLAFGLGGRELAGQMLNSTWKSEQDKARSLAEASELGNEVFPANRLRKPTRMRSKMAA